MENEIAAVGICAANGRKCELQLQSRQDSSARVWGDFDYRKNRMGPGRTVNLNKGDGHLVLLSEIGFVMGSEQLTEEQHKPHGVPSLGIRDEDQNRSWRIPEEVSLAKKLA